MLSKKYKNKKNAFTLVEMLVAIAVFMIVMTVAIGALLSVIDANKKAQSVKNVINNVNFAMESISKDMRMGTNYNCENNNSDCSTVGDTEVSYISNKVGDNGDNLKIHYRFVSFPIEGEGNIQRCIQNDVGNECGSNGVNKWESLTAPTSTVAIKNMRFYVIGNSTKNNQKGNKLQPKVIITIEGESGRKEKLKTDFTLQTTVSQRAREL